MITNYIVLLYIYTDIKIYLNNYTIVINTPVKISPRNGTELRTNNTDLWNETCNRGLLSKTSAVTIPMIFEDEHNQYILYILYIYISTSPLKKPEQQSRSSGHQRFIGLYGTGNHVWKNLKFLKLFTIQFESSRLVMITMSSQSVASSPPLCATNGICWIQTCSFWCFHPQHGMYMTAVSILVRS
jgi:hypothetical protein